MSAELPVGWAHFSLRDLGGLSGGKTPSKANSDFWSCPDVPWVSPKDMKKDLLNDSADKISQTAMDKVGMVLYPTGSVLMVTRSGILQHTFPVALAGADVTVNQDIKVLRPNESISPKLSFYMLKSFGQEVLSACAKDGTTVQSIDSEKLEAFPLPLPPLAEQTRIVQKLDELLAQVDTLKARIDAIPALLKRFRQSVLAAAVSGRLTEEWRSDLTAISIWREASIGSVCISAFDGPFGSKLKSDDYTTEGARVVRLENIGHLNFIGEKKTYIGSAKLSELSKNRLKTGDILFSSFVDEEIRVCRLPKSEEIFINKADCFCLRIDESTADPAFVMYALAAKRTYQRIKEAVHGATRPRINLGFLKSFEISLPSLEEQTEIVRRVERLFAFADQIEAKVKTAQARVNHLTQSILAKAFRGELVPQDPNDEPASVLLQRIQAQRAAAPKTKRGRTAKA
jgi:type I restriction enzyme S subunit